MTIKTNGKNNGNGWLTFVFSECVARANQTLILLLMTDMGVDGRENTEPQLQIKAAPEHRPVLQHRRQSDRLTDRRDG